MPEVSSRLGLTCLTRRVGVDWCTSTHDTRQQAPTRGARFVSKRRLGASAASVQADSTPRTRQSKPTRGSGGFLAEGEGLAGAEVRRPVELGRHPGVVAGDAEQLATLATPRGAVDVVADPLE